MGCKYLSLPEISASGKLVIIYYARFLHIRETITQENILHAIAYVYSQRFTTRILYKAYTSNAGCQGNYDIFPVHAFVMSVGHSNGLR